MNLGRWLKDRARLTGEATAVVCDGTETGYAELDARADVLASVLLGRGLGRGQRVATLTANRTEHVILLFACARAGCALVPLNWRLAPSELAWQIEHCRPGLLAVAPECASVADAALRGVPCAPPRADLVELAATRGRPLRPPEPEVQDRDPLFLFYTSGTTGRPKGAVLTHANCFWTNLSLDRILDLRGDDVVLCLLPQYHVGGWNVQPLLAWWKGATVVLERRFEPAACLGTIARHRVSVMMGVPANYLFMAQDPSFWTADLTSLRLALVGGAPMPEAVLRTWRDRGVELVQGYGLTEAAPNVLCLLPEEAGRRIGWAGKPFPHVDVGLIDNASGRLIAGPGRGELAVRGPNVFPGYWGDPAATAEVLREGWLHTGDIAERDPEGYYRICDRLKDMYISGGENVYPAEVETVLAEHPAVAEAAVVGVPDARWGEVGLAVVRLRSGCEANEEELLVHCRARLAPFKVPRRVRFVDGLPRNSVGKVDKRALAGPSERGSTP
jgi:fatty-acyl-CoA synthase